MPSASERSRTASSPVATAIARVRLVCEETHGYLQRPPVDDPTLREQLARLYGRLGKQVRRSIATAVTDEVIRQNRSSRAVVCAVAQALVGLAALVAKGSGQPEAVLVARHPLVSSWAAKVYGQPVPLPTMRRALACLVDAGVVLYVHGKSKHPSVFGFAWLVDEVPDARAALADRRRDLPGWAQAMVLTLDESSPNARVFDLAAHVERYEARLELEQAARREAQLAWMERKGIDPAAHAAVVDLQRARRQAAAEERRASTWRPDAPEPPSSRDHGDHRNSSPSLREQVPAPRSTPDRARGPSDQDEGRAPPERRSPEVVSVDDDDDGRARFLALTRPTVVPPAERLAAERAEALAALAGAPVPCTSTKLRSVRPSPRLVKGVSTGVVDDGQPLRVDRPTIRDAERIDARDAGTPERERDRRREGPIVSRQVGPDDDTDPPPGGRAS